MKGDGQFDDAKIGTKVASRLRKDLDQLIAHLLGQQGEILLVNGFHIPGPTNSIEKASGGSRRD
jgi:hypothetical protein